MRPEVVAVHIYMTGQFWQLPVTRAGPRAGGCTRERKAAVYKYVYGRAYDLTGPVRASQGSSTAIRGGNKDDRAPCYEPFLAHPGRRCVFPPRVQPRGSTGAETKQLSYSGNKNNCSCKLTDGTMDLDWGLKLEHTLEKMEQWISREEQKHFPSNLVQP